MKSSPSTGASGDMSMNSRRLILRLASQSEAEVGGTLQGNSTKRLEFPHVP